MPSHITRRWILAPLLLALGCSPSSTSSPTVHPQAVAIKPAELAKNLSMLATGTPSAVTDAEHKDVSAMVEQLLSDENFGKTAARVILGPFAESGVFIPLHRMNMALHRTSDAEGAVFYLQKACTKDKAVSVNPWWAPHTTVLVCPDSYRPTQFTDDRGRQCDAFDQGGAKAARARSLRPESPCGCGPYLMRCQSDNAHYDEVRDSLRREAVDTIAYIVNADLPLSTIATSNATFRDKNAEHFYRRMRVEAGEDPDKAFAEEWGEPRWQERPELEPGQHAGVLTTPQLLWQNIDRRATQKVYFEVLWRIVPASSGVLAEDVFKIGATSLREGEGWQRLASMPICTNCHARMDYGMQFFMGWTDARNGMHYINKPHQEEGPLYGNDIDDPRGTAKLNPLGFAKFAVQQKEFGRAMVRDVVEHVFGPESTAEDRAAITSAFKKTGTFRGMMRVALLRYAQRLSTTPPPVAAPPQPVAAATATDAAEPQNIALKGHVGELFEKSCVACHSKGNNNVVFGASLPRAMALKALTKVAFGEMPPKDGLDQTKRRAFVEDMIEALWPNQPDARQEATAYFRDWRRSVGVYKLGVIKSAVWRQAGANQPEAPSSLDAPRELEAIAPADALQLTPGMAATYTLEALDACRAKGGDRRECLKRAITFEEIAKPSFH